MTSDATTYRFQSSTGQDPLRRRCNAASIALQIPDDFSGTQLREHLRDLLYLSRVHGIPTTAGPATASGTIVAVKKPSYNEERDNG